MIIGKPPTPYVKGSWLQINAHVPASPTHNGRLITKEDQEEMRKLSPLQRCLQRHHARPSSIGPNTLSILIAEEVQLRDGGAQVVSVRAPDLAGQQSLIAKFYDPLYYKHGNPGDIDGDPFRCAKHDYCHETAVYEALGDLHGTVVPTYYGSYACDLTGPEWTRSVYLILIEFISGRCMRDLDPHNFPQPERQTIMKMIVEADSALYAHDVIHRDLHPRNILLCSENESGEIQRIVLIDFGKADVGRNLPDVYTRKYTSGIRVSPLLRWDERRKHHRKFVEYRWVENQWIDLSWVDWDWQSWLYSCWENSRHYAQITPEMRQKWLGSYRTRPLPMPT
ncbi:MAG: hypothetical protein M1836_006072 [Candelina mexicana]|nr:MAG: hypothetical protein M1836_006072 [Candelina mexicana]